MSSKKLLCHWENAFGNDQWICKEKEMIKRPDDFWETQDRKLALFGALDTESKEKQLHTPVGSLYRTCSS